MSLVSTREATPADLHFVAATWFKSVWKNSPAMRSVDYRDFKPGQDRYINGIFKRGFVNIAFPPDNPNELVGFTASEGEVLHFVYVRSVYRRMGIGAALARPLGCSRYSWDMGKLGLAFAQKLQLRYDPFPPPEKE